MTLADDHYTKILSSNNSQRLYLDARTRTHLIWCSTLCHIRYNLHAPNQWLLAMSVHGCETPGLSHAGPLQLTARRNLDSAFEYMRFWYLTEECDPVCKAWLHKCDAADIPNAGLGV